MTMQNLAYLSRADAGTRTPDPFITNDRARSVRGAQVGPVGSTEGPEGAARDVAEHHGRPQNAPTDADDLEMRWVLTQIELCSHVPAATIGYSTGGSEHPSRDLSGRDTGRLDILARRYEQAPDGDGRRAVIDDARAELKLIRGTGIRALPAGESQDDTIGRMLEETKGWTPEDVERSRWRMPARMVRRYRGRADLNPETGTDDSDTLAGSPRVQRVVAMAEKGMTSRQIAAVLNVSQPTVVRDLGRRAA